MEGIERENIEIKKMAFFLSTETALLALMKEVQERLK